MDLDVTLEVIDDATVGETVDNERRIVLLGALSSALAGIVVSSIMIVILIWSTSRTVFNVAGKTYESALLLCCLKDRPIWNVKRCRLDDWQCWYDIKNIEPPDLQV